MNDWRHKLLFALFYFLSGRRAARRSPQPLPLPERAVQRTFDGMAHPDRRGARTPPVSCARTENISELQLGLARADSRRLSEYEAERKQRGAGAVSARLKRGMQWRRWASQSYFGFLWLQGTRHRRKCIAVRWRTGLTANRWSNWFRLVRLTRPESDSNMSSGNFYWRRPRDHNDSGVLATERSIWRANPVAFCGAGCRADEANGWKTYWRI